MPSELTQIVGIGEVSGNFRCSQPQSAAFARAFTRQQPLRAPVGPLWDFWYLCWVGAQELADKLGSEAESLETIIETTRADRKNAPRHCRVCDLDETERLDVIRMVAYRAETRMMLPVIQAQGKKPISRKLLRSLTTADAHILPDPDNGIVRVHILEGMLQIIRWFPKRAIIFVGEGSFGTHELAHGIARHATLISRLRLDASLFAPPEPRAPGQRGRPRQKGKPRPKFQTRLDDPATRWIPITLPRWYGGVKDKTLDILSETALWYRPGTPPKAIRWVLVRDPAGQQDPQAFFSTDPGMDPAEIIDIFVRRWQVEVTFQEVRTHLGVETQRQWSDDAIERTTPVLLGLYSLVCLWAGEFLAKTPHPYRAACYWKSSFTFSDAIAAVRTQLWLDCILQRSASDREQQKIMPFNRDHYDGDSSIPEHTVKNVPPERIQRMVEALCFAA